MASVGGIQCPALSSYRQSLAYCLPLLHKLQKQQKHAAGHMPQIVHAQHVSSHGATLLASCLRANGVTCADSEVQHVCSIVQCSMSIAFISGAASAAGICHNTCLGPVCHCTTWAFETCGPEFACLQGSSAWVALLCSQSALSACLCLFIFDHSVPAHTVVRGQVKVRNCMHAVFCKTVYFRVQWLARHGICCRLVCFHLASVCVPLGKHCLL
jgi:hypothetical protein